jgi:hypothetical protein
VTAEEKIKATREERSIFTNVDEFLKECDQNECECLWPLASRNTGGGGKKLDGIIDACLAVYIMVPVSRVCSAKPR